MIPPKGFKAEMYPLRHRVIHSTGLSVATGSQNTCYHTLIKNYKSVDDADTVIVNPHNSGYMEDDGAICNKMSIIDKLSLSYSVDYTKDAGADNLPAIKFLWFPIFFSFPEKLDAADDVTTTTVAAILELTKDATEEDVTPLFSSTKLDLAASSLNHPVSSVNFAEVFGTLNLTTNTTAEGVALDYTLLRKALRRYTNKGALRACMGNIRHGMVTEQRPHYSRFIKKFVPRAVRRIMPYSFFCIVTHAQLYLDPTQTFMTSVPASNLSHLGVRSIANYHEWNQDHFQDMSGSPPS